MNKPGVKVKAKQSVQSPVENAVKPNPSYIKRGLYLDEAALSCLNGLLGNYAYINSISNNKRGSNHDLAANDAVMYAKGLIERLKRE